MRPKNLTAGILSCIDDTKEINKLSGKYRLSPLRKWTVILMFMFCALLSCNSKAFSTVCSPTEGVLLLDSYCVNVGAGKRRGTVAETSTAFNYTSRPSSYDFCFVTERSVIHISARRPLS